MSALPELKAFALTHILYDPLAPPYLSIPLTLLSLSPIFLFVSYFTLLVVNRRLTILLLGLGSVGNEALSWGLKRVWKGHRPYAGHRELGDGYGMPSSHTQAAAFLVAWGIGYAMTLDRRKDVVSINVNEQLPKARFLKAWKEQSLTVGKWRVRVYLFGLILWSILVAYSRWYLLYHDMYQVLAGYVIGLIAGSLYFGITEYIPLYHSSSLIGKARGTLEWLWQGIGGAGGWGLGDAAGGGGGWGEGWILLGTLPGTSTGARPLKDD